MTFLDLLRERPMRPGLLDDAAPEIAALVEAVGAYRDATDARESLASADGVAGGEEPGEMARLCAAESNAYRTMLAALSRLDAKVPS